MIKEKYNTLNRAVSIRLLIGAGKRENGKPRRVGIVVKDADRKNTVYTKRWSTIVGKKEFMVNMPQSPKVAEIHIFNLSKDKNHEGIKLLEKEVISVKTNIDVIGLEDKKVVEFLKFAQDFSDKAGIISAGIYLSDEGNFVLKYSDVIRSATNGDRISTPARINIVTGQIEVSKEIFDRYTVAGRMGILLHEFSHVYQNKKSSDEVEADLNAARIYLGLGYPRIELINVFANVFYKADTDGNRNRIKQMRDYIIKFDRL